MTRKIALPVYYGEGRLMKAGRLTMSDGTMEYVVTSLPLIKIMGQIGRDKSVNGRWLVIWNVIVWFEKEKIGRRGEADSKVLSKEVLDKLKQHKRGRK